MAAALGGLDVLVFTGGVGENAHEIRGGAVAGLGFLGVAVDESANAGGEGDRDISAATSSVRTLVVRARERPGDRRPDPPRPGCRTPSVTDEPASAQ